MLFLEKWSRNLNSTKVSSQRSKSISRVGWSGDSISVLMICEYKLLLDQVCDTFLFRHIQFKFTLNKTRKAVVDTNIYGFL